MSKRRHSSEQWRGIIQQQRAGGLSVAAFCRRAGVPPASSFAWRRKLRGAATFAEVRIASEAGFQERVAQPAEHDPRGIELRLPGQRCVVVRRGFDRQTLLDRLAALEGEA